MAKTNRKVAFELGAVVMQNAEELLCILEEIQRNSDIVKSQLPNSVVLLRRVNDVMAQVSGRQRFVEQREMVA